MRYYFDYHFLECLVELDADSDLLDDFFKRFFREIHGREIFILLPEETEKECVAHPFVRKVIDSGGRPCTEASLRQDVEGSNGTPFKFFFLDGIPVEQLESDHGYFAVNSSAFEKTWAIITNFSQTVEKTFGSEIVNWKALNEFALPINFVAFSDRYFFSRSEAICDNLFPIFEALKLKSLKKRKLDILIIGKEFGQERHFENRHIEQVFDVLTNYFDKKLGEDRYNLTLIRVDGATTPRDREFHARILATNNLCLKAGKGFDQFDKRGVRPEPETLSIRLFMRSNTHESVLPFLRNFSRAFDKVDDVYGDKRSGIRRLTKGDKTHCLISHIYSKQVLQNEKG